MSSEAWAILEQLLRHVRQVRLAHPKHTDREIYLVDYEDLCERARYPQLHKSVKKPLKQIAVWCDSKGLPPINALAVKRSAPPRRPGNAFITTPVTTEWEVEVANVIACESYPSEDEV